MNCARKMHSVINVKVDGIFRYCFALVGKILPIHLAKWHSIRYTTTFVSFCISLCRGTN
jgi:hypothetical protein